MATIRSSLSLYDGMTGPLQSIHKALNIVLNSFEAVQTASGNAIDTSAIQEAREELARAGAQLDEIQDNIRDAEREQEGFNDRVRDGANAADGLANKFSKLKSIVATLGISAAVKKLGELSDQFTSTRARLNLIADDGGSVEAVQQKLNTLTQDKTVDVAANIQNNVKTVGTEAVDDLANRLNDLNQTATASVTASDNGTVSAIENKLNGLDRGIKVPVNVTDNNSVEILEAKIMASAQRARSSYFDTANAIASMGANARSAFATNDELIAFMEQINKQFVIGGASAQGQAAAMLQLTQAMGAGALRGEELNSILENAPGIARAIESYMGVAEGSIKKYAEEGLITAEIVKNAMFAAADETNAKFDSMPMTWAQIWTSMQNRAIQSLEPILAKINAIANSERIQGMVDGAMDAFSTIVGVLSVVLGMMAAVGSAIYDNWAWISPIIYGVAAALLVYHGAQLAVNTITGISTALLHAQAFAEQVKAAHTMLATGGTFAETAAQHGLNAALMACPIMWVVMLVIALIAVFYAAVGAVNHFAGTSVSATGIIGGAFATLGAHVINTFIVPFWNALASIANFIGNVFNDPVAAVKVLFYDMALTVVGYIKNMAEAIETVINKIPGVTVDITSGLDNFYNRLEQAQQKVKDESGWVEYVKKMDFIDYRDAATAGYNFGEGIEDTIGGLFKTPTLDEMGLNSLDAFNFGNTLDGVYGNTGDTAANTAAAADKLDYMDEDLAWMRDIAEREAINRYTTAEITVEQHNENHITKDTDLDGVMEAFCFDFAEKLDVSAEGVHE